MFTFEGWIGSPFLKRNSQIPGRDPSETAVRQWNLLLLERQTLPAFSVPSAWQKSGHSRFFPLFIAFLTHGKSPVIDQPAASQRLVDEVFLFSVRVDPEFDPFCIIPSYPFVSAMFSGFRYTVLLLPAEHHPPSIQNSCLSKASAS